MKIKNLLLNFLSLQTIHAPTPAHAVSNMSVEKKQHYLQYISHIVMHHIIQNITLNHSEMKQYLNFFLKSQYANEPMFNEICDICLSSICKDSDMRFNISIKNVFANPVRAAMIGNNVSNICFLLDNITKQKIRIARDLYFAHHAKPEYNEMDIILSIRCKMMYVMQTIPMFIQYMYNNPEASQEEIMADHPYNTSTDLMPIELNTYIHSQSDIPEYKSPVITKNIHTHCFLFFIASDQLLNTISVSFRSNHTISANVAIFHEFKDLHARRQEIQTLMYMHHLDNMINMDAISYNTLMKLDATNITADK